ncbi:TetR/AcrR family transcriptional regulator [Elusimicrobiota bacterium]
MSRPKTYPEDIRRKMILDAARKVLAKRGYQDMQLDEVAKKARTAKGTLYLYFKDKMDLLAGVFMDILDMLDERIAGAPRKKDALMTLSGITKEVLEFIEEHQDFFTGFIGGHPDMMRTKAGEKTQARYGRHLELVADRIQDCVKQGSLRKHDALSGALYFDNMVRFFILNKDLVESRGSITKKTREFIMLLTQGLGR